MSETLVNNLNRRIRFAKNPLVKEALTEYKNAIIETMNELGHNIEENK